MVLKWECDKLWGGTPTSMPIFSAETLDFLIPYIPRRGNKTLFLVT